MEISSLGDLTFQLKGKAVVTVVYPDKVVIENREFSGPGEYEAKRVAVTGVASKTGVIFIINQDNLHLVFPCTQTESLTEEQMQAIIETDILFVAEKSAPVVSQLEPKIIVVTNGSTLVEPVAKLSITKEKLPEEPMVVVLKHG